VSFTSGFVTLRPGATAAMQVLSLGVGVPPNPGVQQF
jgi:hypothetical protein